ncbi:PH domain-containing protein [Thermosynechococcus sp. JY1334]|uniref:PH domain-containing protein n=1 Tax=unclassified Thermosynechococcus TaxID=2622553 RepID=UPI002671B3A7|nr:MULTISPECIES: PH domain-containing protein [unclassified Thermosynechococcus]MDR7896723.1 PH domain-containing protein [Thermosynechococcus sp. JY1332]MDR7904120.1 PH domain-containing protein [Thermosynechococcus sp. JY1334]WKT86375.1 PH domain-containing protein [Thermosynechococcus sp. JY1339]WNC55320.1 PH domain-containing protein [Thermosynechococcus sp. JY1331]
MEIIEKSQQRLILRSRPWGVWLAGLIFCVGAAVPIWFAARYELVCRHEVRVIDSRCRWVRSGATGVQITQIPLNRLQGVGIIEQWRSSRGRRYRVYQVHLQTAAGSIAFGEFTRDRQNREAVAERIRRFLQQPQHPPLTLVEDNHWWGFLILAVGWGLGLPLILIGAKVLVLVFDKSAGVVSLQYSSLLRTEKKTFPWHDLKDVVVQLSRGKKGRVSARLALELQNGQVIPLRFYYSSDVRGTQALQATIRAFRDRS